jgi:hypothetical protein
VEGATVKRALFAGMVIFDLVAMAFMAHRVSAQALIEPQRGYVVSDPVRSGGIGVALFSGRYAISRGDNCNGKTVEPGQNIDLWMVEGFPGIAVIAPLWDDDSPDMANSCDIRFEQLADPTPCVQNADGVCDIRNAN